MDDDFVDPNEHYGDDEHNSPSPNTDLDNVGLHRATGYIAAVVCLIAFAYFYNQDWFGSEKVPQESTRAHSMLPDDKPDPVGLVANKVEELTGLTVPGTESVDWAKEEEIAANRSAVADFRSKLEMLSSLSNANSESLVLLRSKVDELRTSEAGAKIASQSKFVQQYIALQEKISEIREPSPVVHDFVKDMKALLQRVEEAKDTSYAPQQFVVDRAAGFIESLKQEASEWKRFDNAVNGLIFETKDLQAGVLLETAINSESGKTDLKLAEALAQAREAGLSAKRIELAQAAREKVEAEADFEKAKIVADTNTVRRKRKDLLAAAAKQKLEQEFNRDRSAINSYLIPFISSGRNLRGAVEGQGPASLSAIKAKGALENTAEGLANLSMVAKNGRPLGGFPSINIMAHMITGNSTPGSYHNTPKYRAIETYLEKAQSLLNKYGPLMVEKGLLAK